MKHAIALLLVAGSVSVSAGAAPPKPVAPGAPGAPALVDLAASWALPMPAGTSAATVALAPADATAILAAPALGEDAPPQLRWLEGSVAAREETRRLASESGVVSRSGRRLVVTPRSGRPLLFRDRKTPPTKTADGDGTEYAYLGRLGAGRLHRVAASFEHDSPGSYLVSPEDGRTMFVHEGSDHVVLSPGGARLALVNELNMPLTVVVASVAEGGPALELVCRARGKAASAEVKGWRGPDAIDLVLALGEREKAERVPVRVSRGGAAWSVAAPEPARLEGAEGFACVAPPPALPRAPAAAGKGAPSRPASKGCAWEELSDPALGLQAWVSRCDYGSRRIDFTIAGRSLAIRYSDGGKPEPVVDVLDLAPGETPERGLRRIFAERTEASVAARCVLAPWHGKKRRGALRFTFVPDAAYAKELAKTQRPDEVPEPPCGEWGDAPDGIQYFEAQPASDPARVLFVRVGQDEPLFDEETLRLLPAR